MIDALHISESGLQATQQWIDSLSNNVANMNTAGYKKSVVSFRDLVSSPIAENGGTGSSQAVSSQHGMGTAVVSSNVDFSAGSMRVTGRPLDLAISGEGFFEVVLDDGSFAYSRLGNLQVNTDGYITTTDGFVLSDNIQLPPGISDLTINENGNVVARFDDEGETLDLGQIQIASIANPNDLTSIGASLYKVSDDQVDVVMEVPGQNGVGNLVQGALEMSNVTLVDEMTSLVLAQRAYQLNARIIQTADQILETINNLRR